MDLRNRFLSLTIVAALMGASGCVIGNNARGNVTFLWTMGGNACAVVPDVTQVTIEIPGQQLQNGGVYGCSNSGTAGITLLNFAPGTYSYTIEGRNNGGTAIYFASGKFVVNGDVTVNVTLQPDANATGSAYITWTFPPSGLSGGLPASCAQTVGPISAVEVTIDSATTPAVFTCVQGQTSPGIRVDNLRVGTHTIAIWARGPDHYLPSRDLYYYSTSSQLQVVAGSGAAQQYSLGWTVGGVALKWTFASGGTALTCAQAGISEVYVNLRDSEGKYFPDTGGVGVAVPCVNGTTGQGTTLPSSLLSYVYAGTYQIVLQARDSSNRLYISSQVTPPTTVVTAGVFPQVDGATQTVVLTR